MVAALLITYALLSLFGGVVLTESALHVPRLPVTRRNEFQIIVNPWSDMGVTDASVSAPDGVSLKGWYVRPRSWNGDSVILLHGMGDNRQGAMGYAPMFLRAGYAVLLPDSRAHGESGGAIATYGLLESTDLQRWSAWIQDQTSTHNSRVSCMYLFGESMGAAIALQASERVSHVCAVVAEAPFSSLREIAFERISQNLGLSPGVTHVIARPLVSFAFFYARVRYGLGLDDVSPEKDLARSRVPALLIAGLRDTNIPIRHSERILARCGAGCELWRVAGAEHTGAVSVNPRDFESRVTGWFEQHLTAPVRAQ
jgi:fermentation-respiration switch protein FrsA (DUF1100 family)